MVGLSHVTGSLYSLDSFNLDLPGGTGDPFRGHYNNVLHQANFDNVTVGNAPSPQVGTYVVGQGLADYGGASAPSGTDYLDSYREQNEDFYRNLFGDPRAKGTAIHMEADIYAISVYPAIGPPQKTSSVPGMRTTNHWNKTSVIA